jgi:hypothetical protein
VERKLSGNLDAASPRLALTGAGRIALNRQRDAEITFRFHDSFLDPYVRMFEPRLSEYTTAVVSGSIRIVGELADVDHLLVDGTVDSVDMRLFDYAVRNASPVRLSLDHNEIKGRRPAAGRSRHAAARFGIDQPERRKDRTARRGRSQPRRAARDSSKTSAARDVLD